MSHVDLNASVEVAKEKCNAVNKLMNTQKNSKVGVN